MMEKKFDFLYILRIAGVLFLISALVALLLSAVNMLTEDKIAANSLDRMNDSIAGIFGGDITSVKLDGVFQAPVKDIYEVYDGNDSLLGYAVYAVPTGFKGDIEMMIGVTLAGNCKNVEIISMSETPGLGTKVGEAAHLDQYHNAEGHLVLGEDIIPVAGATISSRTVNTAVNAAVNAVGGITG